MDPSTAPEPLKSEISDADGAAEIVVDWNGHTWSVPHPDDWDIDVAQALELGQAVTFLQRALGSDQWKRFRRGDRRKSKDAAELMNKITGAIGEARRGE